MALSKEDLADIADLIEARAQARGTGKTEEQKRRAALVAKIKAAAHKSSSHAHYVVGGQGAYREGVLYGPGQVIRLPLDENPSHTWKPASSKGIAAAERAAALKADETAELVAELDDGDAGDDDEAKKSGKGKKPGKGGRAADQDVA